MFFTSKLPNTNERELWLFEELDGSVKLSIRGPERKLDRHVQALYESRGVLIVLTRDSEIHSLARDHKYYGEIDLFFRGVFMNPSHMATRSDFLVWSLAHCEGVSEKLFKKMGSRLPNLVEEAMFGTNMDFVVNYLTYSSNPSVMLTQIALWRDKGEYWTLLRALQYKYSTPKNEATYLRQSGGVERVLAALVQLDYDKILELGRLFARVFRSVDELNGDSLTELFMKNPEAKRIFHQAPFWSTTMALSMRMALAVAPEWPHLARIAFTTCLWLKAVCSPMIQADGHPKALAIRVQRLANTLTERPQPGERKTVNEYIKSWRMWVDENALPPVPSTKSKRLNLEPDYLKEKSGFQGMNKLKKDQLICRFLSIVSQPVIQRMYQEMLGDWKVSTDAAARTLNEWQPSQKVRGLLLKGP